MKTIPLAGGVFALVDDDDYEMLMSISTHWYRNEIQGISYVKCHLPNSGHPGHILYMHRVVMNAPSGVIVDHINGNGLDNQRGNLRVASRSENNWNRHKPTKTVSGFKGVYFNKKKMLYRVVLCANGGRVELGHYHDPILAARRYDEAARKVHGNFACLNFPDSEASL